MGITRINMEVGRPAEPEAWEIDDFLVDSGASYSVVQGDVLERLGIRPLSEERFRLANGDQIVRKKGIAAFRLDGRIGGADVIFGEPGDMNLLGAFTLEALGLSLDPINIASSASSRC